MLTVKVLYLPLLLLLTIDGNKSVAESLSEISYQSFFYPFGDDAHDTSLYTRDDTCRVASYSSPEIFVNSYGIYVSLKIDLLKVNDYTACKYTLHFACSTYLQYIIVKKLSSLQCLLRTTSAISQV